MEYNVLGYRLRVNTDKENASVSAKEVAELVTREASKIKLDHPQVDQGQIAVLLAMKLAEDKLVMEKMYKDNLDKLQARAGSALQYIEEVSPTTM